jgi:acyl-CoA synthetase (NDP forming)
MARLGHQLHSSPVPEGAPNPIEASAWDDLFNPASIGIVGISSKGGPFQVGGRAMLGHLAKHGYGGEVFPISRSQPEIDGYRTSAGLADWPHPPRCLVIAVAADTVLGTIRAALDQGIRAFVLITSGFAETGSAGAALQAEVAELIHSAGAVMLGPNTTGYVNFAARTALSSTSRLQGALPPTGPIGVVVQSGALGSAILDLATDRAVGLSYLISSGNEASHGLADFIDVLVDDPVTRVIAIYAEGFKAPARFVAAVERARAAGKPVVLLKAGVTEAGQEGGSRPYRGPGRLGPGAGCLFRQLGIVVVPTLEALVDTAALLARPGPRFGRNLGILTISGRLGGLLADDLARQGDVALPDLDAATKQRLAAYLPPYFTLTNPLDNGGVPFRRPGEFERCLQDFADDPALDGVVVACTPIVAAWGAELTIAAEAVADRSGKPVAVCLQAGAFCADAAAELRRRDIPTFTSVAECSAALSAAISYRPHGARAMPPRQAVALALPDLRVLDEAASKALLKRYGLATPREAVVPAGDPAALCAAASAIGFPVVLKALLDNVAHKTELGLVTLSLRDEAALLAASRQQHDAAARSGQAPVAYLVAEMLRPAAEILVGVSVDPQFGPVLTVGAGGVHAEIFDDVAQRVLPVEEAELRAMIAETKIAQVLRGARGQPPLDIDAVVAFMAGLARLAMDIGPRLAGIEVNPLAVFPAGQGVSALDAKLFLEPAGA